MIAFWFFSILDYFRNTSHLIRIASFSENIRKTEQNLLRKNAETQTDSIGAEEHEAILTSSDFETLEDAGQEAEVSSKTGVFRYFRKSLSYIQGGFNTGTK